MSGYTNMATNMPYKEPMYSGSQWLEQQEKKSRRSKWLVIGSIIALVALIAGGVAAGVIVSQHNKKSSPSSSLADNNSGGKPAAVNQTDPSDPSTFVKNANLKHSFYGIAYTPEGSQLPDCGNSLADVIQDVQLMSQLTSRVRLYGADCNQTALLEAIKQTKVDMKVYLGIYNVLNDGGAAYVRQRDTIVDALKTYGADNVLGITVGNEVILNWLTDNGGGDDPNGAVANVGAQLLLANITDARTTFGGLGLSKTIPIGNSDAGSYFSSEVLAAVDYGMANVHPWFANVSIDQAADWTADFFLNTDIAAANNVTNKPQMFIAETGWPSGSKDVGSLTNGPSLATVDNLQKYLDTFVCQANQNGTGYFYFEYFDEPWKNDTFGGVEGYWGLFDAK
ncbi:glycoside hydrolase [Trametopsis cervina]|nr:glycoside hydrolase [Trametopsis cervina]